jgi:hypothetical protein
MPASPSPLDRRCSLTRRLIASRTLSARAPSHPGAGSGWLNPCRRVNQPANPERGWATAGGKGRHAAGDVRVLALLVGGAVMPVVLMGLPPVAQPDEDAGHDSRAPLVPRRRGEDLAMSRVVAEKSELGEDDREQRGDADLEPGVAEQLERHPDRRERQARSHDPRPVPGIAAPQQLSPLRSAGKVGVRAHVAAPGPRSRESPR